MQLAARAWAKYNKKLTRTFDRDLDDVPEVDGEEDLDRISTFRRRRHVEVVVVVQLDEARLEVVGPPLGVPRRGLLLAEGIRTQVTGGSSLGLSLQDRRGRFLIQPDRLDHLASRAAEKV